jgi:NSS family neurotransmitter:Na+ symporter
VSLLGNGCQQIWKKNILRKEDYYTIIKLQINILGAENINLFGMDFLSFMDYISNNVLLTLGGMFICIFVGWIWGVNNAKKEITNDGTIKFGLFGVWSILVKFVAPIAIFILFLNSIGVFSF